MVIISDVEIKAGEDDISEIKDGIVKVLSQTHPRWTANELDIKVCTTVPCIIPIDLSSYLHTMVKPE